MNFSYHAQGKAIYCKSFIARSKQNHIQFKMGFKRVLLKLFSEAPRNARYNYI